ncbi:MAG: LUD domain-containing protein [Candidatus Aenigmatarchaeota archaeon]
MGISNLLASERIIKAKELVEKGFRSYLLYRQKSLEKVDVEKLKKELRRIKEISLSNLEELKKKVIENLEAQGIKVFEAKDAKEAREILLKLIPKNGKVVKSKSNVISEIELKKYLEKRNEVIETDCGDFLIEICEESSIHPVTPALHIPIEKIVKKIEEKFKVNLEKSPEKIVAWIREYLRKEILSSKIGLTGANTISSDGGIFILENEGNISLVSKLVEKHIIVAGIDKIVPSIQDAITICQALAIWGTGTSLPSYINVISSPSKTADIKEEIVYGAHGPKEVFLVLIDNGRSKMIKNGLAEILYCINCGSCLYFCPVYKQIFDSYGYNYFGGIGVAKTAFINDLKKAFDKGLYYCTTCESCKVNCPLEIDVAEIIRKLREISVSEKIETEGNKKMVENIRKYGNPFGKIEEGKIPKELYCC